MMISRFQEVVDYLLGDMKTLSEKVVLVMAFLLLFPNPLRSQKPAETGVPKGYMVIEGDIVVLENFLITYSTWRPNSFWPNGIVPFRFDANVTAQNQAAMLAAMAEWVESANVHFVPRTTENDFVHIQNSETVNNSEIGRVGGQQVINIVSWWNRWIICHELAHTLGIWHEQSRPDRDTYIQILTQNIQSGQGHNFDRYVDAGIYGPYDFESVMHYDQCAFSIDCPLGSTCTCTNRTIVVLPPHEQWQNLIGQRDHLSYLDRTTMSFLYPQPDWRFFNSSGAGPGQGTFFVPYRYFDPTYSQQVPIGGVSWIQPGNYSSVGTYERSMTIKAPLGGVVLGQF